MDTFKEIKPDKDLTANEVRAKVLKEMTRKLAARGSGTVCMLQSQKIDRLQHIWYGCIVGGLEVQ